MSGFEIAGILLGAIPLVISALERYSEGFSTMRNMRNYEYVFQDIHTSFTASVAIYKDSCYTLLRPLNLSDSQTTDLLEERKMDAWKDPTLHNSLGERLGDNSKVYLLLIDRLNRRIKMFGKRLELGDDLKHPWIAADGTIDETRRKDFFKNPWRRIKGGFDSGKYATLLKAIDDDIDRITKLTASAIDLAPIQKERVNVSYWRNIRDRAQGLFESLSSQFCPCSCQHSHQANLRLDVRRHNNAEKTFRLAFLFIFGKDACTPASPPWNWRAVEIETLRNPNMPMPLMTSPQTPSITVSGSPPASITSQACAPKIEKLCDTLMQGAHSNYCLGFLEDQDWQHHIYYVLEPETHDKVKGSAPLHEIVCGASQSLLTTRQRCTLALTLASAVLQLHDTPWLSKNWDMKDIHILENNQGISLADNLYVSHTFAPSSLRPPSKNRRRCVKNEIVFALGVALLELSFGKPLLRCKTDSDLNEQGNEDSMTVVSIASRLADEIHFRELPNYAKAVVRCIRCDFDTFDFNFEEEEFLERFYDGVVVPLQEDYEYATGTRTNL